MSGDGISCTHIDTVDGGLLVLHYDGVDVFAYMGEKK
jgi:hypothetical protein